jgi:hypothetical protein
MHLSGSAGRSKKVTARGRAGPPGRRRRPCRLAGDPARPEPHPPSLPRRERLRHEQGPPLWPQPARTTARRAGAARPLEDLHPGRRPALGRHRRAARHRSPDDGLTFRAYVEQHLAPTLAPGDIVVCDNLQCHKTPSVRAAIEARGAELRYLPPYSPDPRGNAPSPSSRPSPS